MQTRFLIFALFIFIFFACEREGNLLIQEIPEPSEPVIVEEEEETIYFLTSTVDEIEYPDTTGQIIDMGNGWHSISNVRYSEYECSSTAGGYSFSGVGEGQAGGNPSGFNFQAYINLTPGSPLIPKAAFFVPNDEGIFEQYTNLCNNGQGGIGSFSVDITSNDGERISGTYEATVFLAFDPITFEYLCGTPEALEKTITGSFDLPLQYCD